MWGQKKSETTLKRRTWGFWLLDTILFQPVYDSSSFYHGQKRHKNVQSLHFHPQSMIEMAKKGQITERKINAKLNTAEKWGGNSVQLHNRDDGFSVDSHRWVSDIVRGDI